MYATEKKSDRAARASRSAGKFNTCGSAREAILARHRYWLVPVVLGDDGLYWAPTTNRDASALIQAGYEVAP